MAIKAIKSDWCPYLNATRYHFVMDTVADVPNLPQCCTGSTALVAEGGSVYMVNASDRWVDAGITASYNLAEEASF